MKRGIALTVFGLILFASVGWSQEVVVTDFPPGLASDVGAEFFKPYYPRLQQIADTLHKYPSTRAIVTGGADGIRYAKDNDALNPGVALGRAHALRDLLVSRFNIDSMRITIQTEDSKLEGGQYRFAGVRVAWEFHELDAQLDTLGNRIITLENRPPVEKHYTEIREVPSPLIEKLGLQAGAGFSSSPFGGIPIVTGAVTWDRIVYVEAVLGHTFWNSNYRFETHDLDTWRQMAGAHVIYYPSRKWPVGILAGWLRVEEVTQKYYAYVRLSEGPVVGVRVTPWEFASVTAAYNPAKRRMLGSTTSSADNDQFLLYVTAHLLFGGGK